MVFLVAHALQVLHGQHADVHKAVDTVGQARLLAAVQLAVFDGARDALLEAHLGQVVRLSLYPGALLLILDELAQLLLVPVRERAEVGLVDRGVVHFVFFRAGCSGSNLVLGVGWRGVWDRGGCFRTYEAFS